MSVKANSLLTLLNKTPETPASLSGLLPRLTYRLEVSHSPDDAVTEQKSRGTILLTKK